MKKLHLAVLISGSGSNLQALIDACKDPAYPAQIEIVISNRPDSFGIERGKKAGIPTAIVDHMQYREREEFEDKVHEVLERYPVDLICLAGFMRILTPGFVEKWENRIINTHPALLPKHGGKGMYGEHVHRAVLQAGDRESGVSIHYVIPEVDQGKVILQRRVPVLAGDTPDTLGKRVLAEEHTAYVEAVRNIAEKR